MSMGESLKLAAAALGAVAAFLFSNGSVLAGDQAPSDPRAVIAAEQAIPPGGINESKAVKIGGIDQWISVRGASPSNPILLFIHGGPGSPMMPESWTYERPWEDFFTVVQWDQRGSGKTFSVANRQADPKLSATQIQADAEELIDYLRRTYGKDRIFLMGHSWGSIIGLRVAEHKPEALYAYIGVGQVINGVRNEVVGYEETLAEAQAVGNHQAVAELQAIAPYPQLEGAAALRKVGIERKWDRALGGMIYGKTDDNEKEVWALSPAYSDFDNQSAAIGEMQSSQALMPQAAMADFDHVTTFKCPIIFISGSHDRTTPETLVADYYQKITAPQKMFFKIENAAHYVVNEAPGEVLIDLVTYVRPLAGAPALKGPVAASPASTMAGPPR